ncbi:hypothetical protein DFP72DRAFT_1060951 [Ephemerocybe angulata]|uniref:Uncharacterized protein n=1 Tax=Ephemerocybe angulata TaxID=980116 RepID=A0A8H6IBY0_9AGAR|nr:hypothetical protein DFP72DRAFT_1060951 [Tulosesus angulatus]
MSLSGGSSGRKRSRPPTEVEPEDPSADNQAKRRKNTDRLRDHLPEVEEVASFYESKDLDEIRKSILKRAKKRNTIGLLPRQTAVETIYYDFLKWSIKHSKSPESSLEEEKRAVFIVEKEASIEAHAQYIRSKLPGVTCSTDSLGKPRKDARHPDVLVTTSQLFLKALSQSIHRMEQFHAIILEDVQPIRNQGCNSYLPIVQVITDFHLTTPESLRPRIFAIAMSSTLSSEEFDSRLLRLELTLNCITYGVSKERREEITSLPDRPNESVVLYDADTDPKPLGTVLYKKLLGIDPEMKIERKFFQAADVAASKLGSCASDLVWKLALKEIEAEIPTWHEDDDSDPSQSIRIRIRDVIRNWTFAMPNLNPSAHGFNVNRKFLRLVQILESCEGYGNSFSGIIFVQHRSVAYVLTEMLRMLNDKLPFVRPFAASDNLDFRAQQNLFSNFANERYNVMVATKSIDDLGLPQAYDLFDGQISHAYARACTRGKESQLIHLVQRNNDQERQLLSRSSTNAVDVVQWMDTFKRTPRIGLPPPKVVGTSIVYLEGEGEESVDGTYLLHPTTGGRIYPQDATAVLIYAASRIQSDKLIEGNRPLFDFQLIPGSKTQDPTFVCSIHLPGTKLDGLAGPPSPSQYHARRAASFAACKHLLDIGLLDCVAVPLPQSLALQSCGLEQLQGPKSAGTRRYLRKEPFFWSSGNKGPVRTLYPTILTVRSNSTDGHYGPLVLLTRRPLPPFPVFNLFLSSSVLSVTPLPGVPFSVDDKANIGTLHGFTIRALRSLLNKPVSCELMDMSFFLAAPTRDWVQEREGGTGLIEVEQALDWEVMRLAEANWAVPIRKGSIEVLEEDMVDAMIQDRWLEFTRRYHVVKVRTDMTPLSKPTPTEREAEHDSYLAFVEANRKGFEGLEDNEQPLLEVDKVLGAVNNLNPRVREFVASSKAVARYLIPELCAKFVIPSSLFRTVALLPSILTKIDDMLVVKEMNNHFFHNSIREELLCEATTTVSAGMDQDYERLELLGDSFLKYVSSIFVFVANATQNEGSLHISRQKVLSNNALLQASTRVNLPPWVRSTLFNVKVWIPRNYVTLALTPKDKPKPADGKGEEDAPPAMPPPATMVANRDPGHVVAIQSQVDEMKGDEVMADGTQTQDPSKPADSTKRKRKGKKGKKAGDEEGVYQSLGDKTIADVAEAIIGAAYVSGGRECGLGAMKALTVPIPGINTWSDFGARVVIPYPHRVAQLREGSLPVLENIIGHKFQQPHLLAQAMTHTTARTSGMTSYERLEFIGDAILDFMVIRYIYDRDHALSPGGLTLLKSAMVSNSTLAAICVSSGLRDHLLFDSQQLAQSIEEYVTVITEKADEENRAAEAERRPAGQFWLGVEPPKALSDVIESVIGAVYISDKFSPVGAEAFFDNVLRPFFDKHITLQTLTHHPTKTLFELIQAHGCQLMKITKDPKCEGATTCHVKLHEETLSSATGPSPPLAARQASIRALEAIKEGTVVLSRICDCRGRAKDKNTWMAQGFNQALSSLIEERSEAQ